MPYVNITKNINAFELSMTFIARYQKINKQILNAFTPS